jgi:hypothetical protein
LQTALAKVMKCWRDPAREKKTDREEKSHDVDYLAEDVVGMGNAQQREVSRASKIPLPDCDEDLLA